jgi:hypothetical protein
MRCILLTLPLLSALHASAQPTAADISKEQIAAYQAKLEEGCVKDAGWSGMEPAKASSFCSCTNNYVRENMPTSEWQLAAYQKSKGAETEKMRILVPYIRNAARTCQAVLK